MKDLSFLLAKAVHFNPEKISSLNKIREILCHYQSSSDCKIIEEVFNDVKGFFVRFKIEGTRVNFSLTVNSKQQKVRLPKNLKPIGVTEQYSSIYDVMWYVDNFNF